MRLFVEYTAADWRNNRSPSVRNERVDDYVQPNRSVMNPGVSIVELAIRVKRSEITGIACFDKEILRIAKDVLNASHGSCRQPRGGEYDSGQV